LDAGVLVRVERSGREETMQQHVVHRLGYWAALVLVGASLLTLPAPASAETYTASNTSEFESAISKANANPGSNTIVLAPGTYTPFAPVHITNTSGTQTIEGPPAPAGPPMMNIPGVVLDESLVGPGAPLTIEPGVSATLNDLLVTKGGGGVPGIEDLGSLDLEGSTVAQNKGSGIIVTQEAKALIRNSTLSNNGRIRHGRGRQCRHPGPGDLRQCHGHEQRIGGRRQLPGRRRHRSAGFDKHDRRSEL
jgi:hypothetical protein